jgi:HK97 family phage portal protein
MGFFRRLFGLEQKGDITSSLALFKEIYGGRESHSGITVNIDSALGVTTVLACVRSIASGIAQVPWPVFQDNGGDRRKATEHPLYSVIGSRPNRWQTSYEFRETLLYHVLLTNNSYVFVNRVGAGRVVKELIPIEPGRVTVEQNKDYSLVYKVRGRDGAEVQSFGADAIWHLRGPSWNSWQGLDAVHMARDAIGLTIALERGQAEFQKGGARTSGVLSVTNPLAPDKFEFLAAWLDKHLPGGDRANKPLIADMGMDYKPFTMTGVDQQLIETRKHQIEEICRAFGVMPIMVGHADKTATYASAEQMFLAHVVHTLSPWYRRVEQSADVNLLTDGDRAAGYYTKFIPNALMRGAAVDRSDFYAKALGSGGTKGWMTQNEVRSFEELDRSDDPEADRLPQPTNAEPADEPDEPDEPTQEPAE